MFAVSAFTRRNFGHETGFCLAGVSRAGLQCYCRAGWRAGREAFVGRIWPAGRRLPDFGLERLAAASGCMSSEINPKNVFFIFAFESNVRVTGYCSLLQLTFRAGVTTCWAMVLRGSARSQSQRSR